MKPRFNAPSALTGLAVGVLLAGGVVWASGSVDDIGEQVCRTRSGYLRVSATGECRRSEVPVDLPQGPRGEQGPPGEMGPRGEPGSHGSDGKDALNWLDPAEFKNVRCGQRPHRGVDFSECDLSEERFNNRDLRGASFVGANLQDVDFSGARLDGADFTDANTQNANFSEASVSNVVGLRSCSNGGPCRVGDIGPGGGTVFRMYNLFGYDGLEIAQQDWLREGQAPRTEWGCADRSGAVMGLNGLQGAAVTARILDFCGDSAAAVLAASTYRGGGLDDWYLPSLGDMLDLERATTEGLTLTHRPADAWTSSQYAAPESGWCNQMKGWGRDFFVWQPGAYQSLCSKVFVDSRSASHEVWPVRSLKTYP